MHTGSGGRADDDRFLDNRLEFEELGPVWPGRAKSSFDEMRLHMQVTASKQTIGLSIAPTVLRTFDRLSAVSVTDSLEDSQWTGRQSRKHAGLNGPLLNFLSFRDLVLLSD